MNSGVIFLKDGRKLAGRLALETNGWLYVVSGGKRFLFPPSSVSHVELSN